MPGILQRSRARRTGRIVLSLLLAASCHTVLPESVRALGGPWPISVSAEGEVRRPGAHTLPAGATLSSLISAADGFTEEADPRGAVLLRVSARAAQHAELRQAAEGLSSETGGSEAAAEAVRPVVDLLLELRPTGRVPVRVIHPRLLKNSPDDLPLENGDTLRIPARAATVAVAGAVRAASGTVPLTPDLPLAEYIRRSGGYAEDAERGHVFLLRADGTTMLLTPGFITWNPAASRWEVTVLAGPFPGIYSGDTIVVPRRPAHGLPSKTARKIQRVLMRASEIAGMPVVLPGRPTGMP